MHQEHRDMFLTKPYKILRLLSMVKPAESKKKKKTLAVCTMLVTFQE